MNLRIRKLKTNDTKTSIRTASVVINANLEIKKPLSTVAKSIAKPDTAINIASSTYHTCLPGLNTNTLFITQQKMFEMTNPIPVARPKRHALTPSETSAEGRERNLTAKSSELRHISAVEARK